LTGVELENASYKMGSNKPVINGLKKELKQTPYREPTMRCIPF